MTNRGDQRHKILLADDDRIVLTILTRVLTDAGHTVETCPDGATAWEKIRTGEFTLLITDEDMPGRRGSELILQLRSEGIRIPVILISSREVMEGSGFINTLDGFAFLKKPLAFSKLHEAIRQVSSFPGHSSGEA